MQRLPVSASTWRSCTSPCYSKVLYVPPVNRRAALKALQHAGGDDSEQAGAGPSSEAAAAAEAPTLRLRKRLGKSRGVPSESGPDATAKKSSGNSSSSRVSAPRASKAAKGETRPSATRVEPETEEELFYQDADKFEAAVLDERSPFYQPALTDEDLAEDPPGHRSGYVAVIGKPNAGKSTFINAVVGQKLSIVTYKPQTTRHRIMGICSGKDFQMVLFDTPGVIEKKHTKLEERMMAAVISSIKESEAIIAVVDSQDNPKDALGMFQPGENWNGPPMAVLLNKADLMTPEGLEELSAWYKQNCRAEAVFVGSAKDNSGIDAIKQWAVTKLPEGPTLYPKDIVSEQPERFFVSECVREQIFLHYEQEVPYCTQVVVKEFTERQGRKDYISAEIIVEKESQKGILIGKGGDMLKKVGAAARKEIEAFLGRGVFLELSVQVSKDWRDSKDALKTYGYFDPMLI